MPKPNDELNFGILYFRITTTHLKCKKVSNRHALVKGTGLSPSKTWSLNIKWKMNRDTLDRKTDDVINPLDQIFLRRFLTGTDIQYPIRLALYRTSVLNRKLCLLNRLITKSLRTISDSCQ